MEDDYRDSRGWQEALALAERVYRLAATVRAPEARSLMGRLTDAAGAVPGRLAQVVLRVSAGEEACAARQQAESRLLDVETLLLLSVRLGYLEQDAVNRVLTIHAEVLRLLPAGMPAAEPVPAPAVTPPAVPAKPSEKAPRPSGGGAPVPAAGPTARPDRKARPAERVTEEYREPVHRLVVDGCNFLGRAVGYSLSDDATRDKLLFRLQEYGRRHPAHQILVFFDGKRASQRQVGGVEQRITSGIRPADDIMVDYITGLSPQERGLCTLVTDDRELGLRAKRLGAAVLPVGDLVARLSRDAAGFVRKEDGLNQGALAEWEAFFSRPPERPGR